MGAKDALEPADEVEFGALGHDGTQGEQVATGEARGDDSGHHGEQDDGHHEHEGTHQVLAKVGGQEQGLFDQLAVKYKALCEHGGEPGDDPAARDHEHGK